jgi:hypothetical protein
VFTHKLIPFIGVVKQSMGIGMTVKTVIQQAHMAIGGTERVATGHGNGLTVLVWQT